MVWSFKIGRVFGIDLRVHITFFLIVAWAAYMWGGVHGHGAGGAIYGAVLILLLFFCVVIHELSHSRMAQHFGAEVASITLLPIGGLAMLRKMPEDPGKELAVSVVGPLSNVVIAALLAVVYAVIPGKIALENPEQALEVITSVSLQGLVAYLLFVNIMLAVFNLLPAFPLDGGRVLRSILAQRMPYRKATRAAVAAGQVFAFILGITGLLSGAWLWVIIAVFIYMGAEQEGAGAEMKSVFSRLKVADAAAEDVKVLSPADRLGDVVAIVLHGYQEDFPVLEGEAVTGILTRTNLIDGLHRRGPDVRVGEVMLRDFPAVTPGAPFSEVYDRINETRVKAVPVIEDGKLLGMVTLEHLSEVFMLLSSTDEPLLKRK